MLKEAIIVIDEVMKMIKERAVSICNVNVVSVDDLLKILELWKKNINKSIQLLRH